MVKFDKNIFNDIIKKKEIPFDLSFSETNNILEKYPAFNSLQLINAVILKKENPDIFEKKLTKIATNVIDRSILHDMVHRNSIAFTKKEEIAIKKEETIEDIPNKIKPIIEKKVESKSIQKEQTDSTKEITKSVKVKTQENNQIQVKLDKKKHVIQDTKSNVKVETYEIDKNESVSNKIDDNSSNRDIAYKKLSEDLFKDKINTGDNSSKNNEKEKRRIKALKKLQEELFNKTPVSKPKTKKLNVSENVVEKKVSVENKTKEDQIKKSLDKISKTEKTFVVEKTKELDEKSAERKAKELITSIRKQQEVRVLKEEEIHLQKIKDLQKKLKKQKEEENEKNRLIQEIDERKARLAIEKELEKSRVKEVKRNEEKEQLRVIQENAIAKEKELERLRIEEVKKNEEKEQLRVIQEKAIAKDKEDERLRIEEAKRNEEKEQLRVIQENAIAKEKELERLRIEEVKRNEEKEQLRVIQEKAIAKEKEDERLRIEEENVRLKRIRDEEKLRAQIEKIRLEKISEKKAFEKRKLQEKIEQELLEKKAQEKIKKEQFFIEQELKKQEEKQRRELKIKIEEDQLLALKEKEEIEKKIISAKQLRVQEKLEFEVFKKKKNEEYLRLKLLKEEKELELKQINIETTLKKEKQLQETKNIEIKLKELQNNIRLEEEVILAKKNFEKENSIINKQKPESFIGWLNDVKKQKKELIPFDKVSTIEADMHQEIKQSVDPLDNFISKQIAKKKINRIKKLTIQTKDNNLVSETLAEILITQQKYIDAIEVYGALSLKYPEKSSYFASQIKKIKTYL